MDLIDLLWRGHPAAPRRSPRGRPAKTSTDGAVRAAVAVADAEGLGAVTTRRLAHELGVSAMTLYGHVGPRDDLLVLMADDVHRAHTPSGYPSESWRDRVRTVAQDNLALHTRHGWLLDIVDQRLAFGPGTIAKYDRELHAFDAMALSDLDRDGALTFVLDFARGSARAALADGQSVGMAGEWARTAPRLAAYLGDAHPLAQRVGGAAGADMNAAYSASHAWRFGLGRVLDALEPLATP
ncbi:TetR/AcrR family transcriptional regulator C-terminal domain-containing protein [Rhodococcus sp. HNM0569]|uniref:TetR/AcrR family transcriptional regulator n=1 Tax=Rhodococcus sp. HNM0569 TaxID=2716340 RepID=UPI00146AA52B|nr:TetR/AcrR family transcriptional regulator C-terminal domain-containing protein [Rhodococcus sp. HNM0569]NLU82584.1 TetR family transcriptional regulator [Rhodococcus sp. HNM0569]